MGEGSERSLGFREMQQGEELGRREGEAGVAWGKGPPCLEGLSVSPTVPHAELELSALEFSRL